MLLFGNEEILPRPRWKLIRILCKAISKRIITVVAKPLRAINLHPVGAVAAAIS